MTDAIISIPGAEPLAVLDARGWVRGSYGNKLSGPVCLHGAIRLCALVPGDAQIVESVARKQGWGTAWNDDHRTDEGMVRALLAKGIEITDDDMYATFGPQWEAVVWVVRRATVLTRHEIDAIDTARNAARATARNAARASARAVARSAARDAAWIAAWDAAVCAAVWDLARDAGRFTFAQRELLMCPWEQVIGLPPTLTRSTTT